MRRLALVMLGLLACADEEKVIVLEKKVAALEAELASTRKELEQRVDDLEQRKLERQVEDLERKLDKLAAQQARPVGGAPLRPPRVEPDPAHTYSVPVAGYPSIGPADAKITIVVASDYACPFCEKSRATLRELRRKYGNDLRLVFKPLVIHPQNAMAGALAACAAHRQGKFAQMDDAIWDKGYNNKLLDQSDVVGQPGAKCWDTPEGCHHVVGYARDLGLNVAKLKQDMRDCMPTVSRALADHRALSVAATPAFFINGRFLSGARPLDSFTTLVDEELRKASERIAKGTKRSRYYEEWVVEQGKKTVDPIVGAPGVP